MLANNSSGLQLLLLEDYVSAASAQDNTVSKKRVVPQFHDKTQADERTPLPGDFPLPKTPLHRQLISLCLHNPYWNDFRLLHYFHKHNVPMSMEDLLRLKQQCGLDHRETICNTLLRLAREGGLKLNNRQISFIEKVKPEFRDRDIQSNQPGELLVYACLFGRGIGDIGRVYVHLFVDMFTGYTFGELSRRRTRKTGLRILEESILPLYRAHNQVIQTILHTTRTTNDIKEFDEMESNENFSRLGIQWIPTRRTFGVIEKFEKNISLSKFFESQATNAPLFTVLQSSFTQWLKKYNSANRFFSQKNVLQLYT